MARKLPVCNYLTLSTLVSMEDPVDLSEYTKSLPKIDKERHRQKLSVNICGQQMVLKDPYTLDCGWISEVTKLALMLLGFRVRKLKKLKPVPFLNLAEHPQTQQDFTIFSPLHKSFVVTGSFSATPTLAHARHSPCLQTF